MYIINPTTPANFFHSLRRQVKNEFRIPLIIMTPKSLLRNPEVISPLDDFTNGEFQEIIDDPLVKNTKNIKRVLLCSGKIYYELNKARSELKVSNIAIVRIEQFYPIPKKQDKLLFDKYKNSEWYWIQEEPENMGGWYFIRFRFNYINFSKIISRKKSASPAHGSSKKNKKEQEEIIKKAFQGLS